MKKLVIILAIIMTILCLNKQETVVIPKDSIRFRVIASSNRKEDQELKKEIVKNLSQELKKTTFSTNIEDTRKYLIENLPTFESVVEKTLEEKQSEKDFHIHYGKNYFPEKEYKEVLYEEGEYESLVVTLGEGKGENFWCVLFPPLCFVEEEDVEYKSFIKEIIDKYF